jgi:hydrogenase-4 component B
MSSSFVTVTTGLQAQALLALVAVLAAVTLPAPARRPVGALLGVLLGAAGVLTGAAAWAGRTGSVELGTVLPGIRPGFAPDRLGGAFLVLVSAVTVLAALWSGGGHATPARSTQAAFPVFALGLMAVTQAADVVAFLLAWELMAVASTVLVLTDHARRPGVLGAGLWYAGMTQLSFLLVLAGFGVLADAAGGIGFDALGTVDPLGTPAAVGVGLLVVGFVAKAGAVPLHVWLPKAHPEAPSQVSALMSAAMVKAGIYGVLLVLVRLLPGGPRWWGVLVLAFGVASALFGILQASVAADLKRLLAYSTTENVGLILCAIGAAQVTLAAGDTGTGQVLLVAALLLTVAHAAAKSTLFLTAGSILHATGLRDLDRLGGLWRPMPWTCAAFGIAAVGAAGLPVSAGFVAEWTLLQALVHGGRPEDPTLGVMAAVVITVVALTAGLALMTFTKAFGIAFLGRARSPEADGAHEVSRAERVAALLGAAAVLGLGLLPGPLAAAAAAAIGATGVSAAGTSLTTGIRLDGLVASSLSAAARPATGAPAAVAPVLDPVALAVLAVAAGIGLLVAAIALRRRVPRRHVELAWGCGGERVGPRMQYTATSYAEPLVRVFDGVLGVARSVDAEQAGAPYLEHEVRFRQRLRDVVEERGYRPLLAGAERAADAARRLQNGSVRRYLAWSFGAFLLVLTAASR